MESITNFWTHGCILVYPFEIYQSCMLVQVLKYGLRVNVCRIVLFCYEKDFMMSLSDHNQADVIDGFTTTSRYLDDILNINDVCFDNIW